MARLDQLFYIRAAVCGRELNVLCKLATVASVHKIDEAQLAALAGM